MVFAGSWREDCHTPEHVLQEVAQAECPELRKQPDSCMPGLRQTTLKAVTTTTLLCQKLQRLHSSWTNGGHASQAKTASHRWISDASSEDRQRHVH